MARASTLSRNGAPLVSGAGSQRVDGCVRMIDLVVLQGDEEVSPSNRMLLGFVCPQPGPRTGNTCILAYAFVVVARETPKSTRRLQSGGPLGSLRPALTPIRSVRFARVDRVRRFEPTAFLNSGAIAQVADAGRSRTRSPAKRLAKTPPPLDMSEPIADPRWQQACEALQHRQISESAQERASPRELEVTRGPRNCFPTSI